MNWSPEALSLSRSISDTHTHTHVLTQSYQEPRSLMNTRLSRKKRRCYWDLNKAMLDFGL